MEQYHPIYSFTYFCLVIGCSMFLLHPICLLCSLSGAVCYTVYHFGWKRARKGIGALAFLMVITAVMNPAFSHQGVTVITYLPTGNVLTLESILYGAAAACMLAATLLWFRSMGDILTTDKIVYLFGKGFPILGLLLAMVLGFLPKIQRKLSEIRMCRLYPREEERAGGVRRIRNGIENLSILITWMLEDAVYLADSMRSRGYGLEGRTSFAVYRFTKRDGRGLLFLLAEAVYLFAGICAGGLRWDYYPATEGAGFGVYSVSLYLVYWLMCMAPFLMELERERKWNRLKSAI